MCGIIGYTGQGDAVPAVLEGLKRLEYRGYDSAGIAFLNGPAIDIRRCKGKIKDLYALFDEDPAASSTAIGHTRWATHGKPSEVNAHPHRSGDVVVVHNGIIENYTALKKELAADGYDFSSETDTEIICHLVNKHSKGAKVPLEDAVRCALKAVRGSFAIAVMSEGEPGKIVGARKDCPLVLGLGEDGSFVASDVPAFLNHTRDVIFLEDGQMAVLGPGRALTLTDFQGKVLPQKAERISWSPSMAEKGGYRHFMLKEIFEQPRALADTIGGRVSVEHGRVNLEEFGVSEDELAAFKKIFIVACGTSWHAALCGKYMVENMAAVPVEVDIASEFRYRNPLIKKGDLFISITQSGETADTLAAQRLAKKLGARTLSICNVIGSTAAREADSVFYTRSGPEIGVASTKSFTTQLAALYMLAVALGGAKKTISKGRSAELLEELLTVPDKVEEVLLNEAEVISVAKEFFKANDFLYLGRGIYYPIALEGALKLKEISYIHAEAYPAGEMKHGPIALIDESMPVLFVASEHNLPDKTLSNMQEVRSRGGRIICVADESGEELKGLSERYLRVPPSKGALSALILAVPLQLLSYHIGVLRGCDVDQPRNLAKSVTVE